MTRLSKFILVVFLCFIIVPVYAGRMDYLKGVGTVATPDYSDITLWIGFENCGGSPCQTDYTLSTDDYTAGEDSVYSRNSLVEVNSSAAQLGSFGCEVKGSGDYYSATDSTDGAFNPNEFRLGCDIYRNGSIDDNFEIFRKYADATHYLVIRWQGTDDITAYYYDNGTALLINTSSDFIADTTKVFVEVSYYESAGTGYLEVFGDGSSKGTDSGSFSGDNFQGGSIWMGDNGANSGNYYIDQVIVSNDHTRDLNALKDLVTAPL